MKKYKLVAVGGTFDHLHKGHRGLLEKAFRVAEKVVIGVTAESLIADKSFAGEIEPLLVRQEAVKNFLKKRGLLSRSETVILKDFLGPIRSNKNIEAVVVSPLTPKVNLAKLPQKLTQIFCETVKDKSGQPLSSSRIRRGLVNREGEVYGQMAAQKLFLPRHLRQELRKPLGEMVDTTFSGQGFLVAVGDVSAQRLLQTKIKTNLFIVDFQVQRQPVYHSFREIGFSTEKRLPAVVNPPGVITREALRSVFQAISDGLKDNQSRVLKIDGEEDLLVIPAILYAPLGARVIYGQPPTELRPEGLVAVTVTEEKKAAIQALFNQFVVTP